MECQGMGLNKIKTKIAMSITATSYLFLSYLQSKPLPVFKVNNDYRTIEEQARDKYRHPQETLTFFKIKPADTVVEIWPRNGWYTQIIAPYLKHSGQYIAAQIPPVVNNQFTMSTQAKFQHNFTGKVRRYGQVVINRFNLPEYASIAPTETVDLVLTFRNTHNWMSNQQHKNAFKAIYKALKPGGLLVL